MKVFGANELIADVQSKGLCIGCGACVDLCPYFRNHRGTTINLFPCTSTTGRCFAFCPKIEVDLDELSKACFGNAYTAKPLGEYRKILIAKAADKAGKGDFQAGGVVTAVVLSALKSKKAKAAILTDSSGLIPVPRVAKTAKGVLSCASSKYSAAPSLSALNRAVKEGLDNLVVVATPCQSLSLAQMRLNPTGIDNFSDPTALVIGLFCTWALDYGRLEAFLKKRLDINTIRKFDIPPPPAEVFEVYTNSGKLTFPLSEIRGLVPETCSYCPDMTAEFADISVGVLEGRPDMNTLIIRTERGERFAGDAQKKGFITIEEMPAANLEHLETAAKNKKQRALLKGSTEDRINCDAEGTRAMMRLGAETLNSIISAGGAK
jgi:coenzyme F420 hydrogenase subunit beta